jgi:hypothetical protein
MESKEMPGLMRYVEWMSRGRRTGRVVYGAKEWNVPKPLPGEEWQLVVAIGRVVLTNREHIIALEPLDNRA